MMDVRLHFENNGRSYTATEKEMPDAKFFRALSLSQAKTVASVGDRRGSYELPGQQSSSSDALHAHYVPFV